MAIPARKIIKTQLVKLLSTHGAMHTNSVYAALAESWCLGPDELNAKRSGGSLYQNEIRWARQELAFEGIIARPSESSRGVWKLKNVLPLQEQMIQDELEPLQTYVEGAIKTIRVNAYERNLNARQACLTHHGYKCKVCNFDFGETYGAIGVQRIHVHHLTEISSIGTEYQVDPIKEMVPLCPNCHFMAHQRRPPFSLEELKAMIQKNGLNTSLSSV